MKITSAILAAACCAYVCSATAAQNPQTPPDVPAAVCVEGKCAEADSLTAIRSYSAAAFVDSIGVNVRFSNHKTPYVTSFALAKQKLLDLGVHHVRDAAVARADGTFSASDQAALFREIGGAGIRVAFVFPLNVTQDFVQGFPARVAPSLEAYELPNELNAARADWVATLRQWAPVFQSYVRSSPGNASFPIIGPSLTDKGDNPYGALGDLSSYFDLGNTHAYYSSREPGTVGWGRPGAVPCERWKYGAIGYNVCNAQRVSGSKPVMSTETGWLTNVDSTVAVPEDLHGKYLVRMLLSHFSLGIPRTYIYQLMDSGTDGFNSSGLVTATGQERAAFKEIRALIELLRGGQNIEYPRVVPLALSGDVADVHKIALEKSADKTYAMLWIEKPGMDPITRQRLVIDPRALTMRVGKPYRIVSIRTFDDTGELKPAEAKATGRGDYPLTLTDGVTIVELAR
jgi:hypothetical protein